MDDKSRRKLRDLLMAHCASGRAEDTLNNILALIEEQTQLYKVAAERVGVTFATKPDESGRYIAINKRAEEVEATNTHNFECIQVVSNFLIGKGLLLTTRNEDVDGALAPALNITDSIEALINKVSK